MLIRPTIEPHGALGNTCGGEAMRLPAFLAVAAIVLSVVLCGQATGRNYHASQGRFLERDTDADPHFGEPGWQQSPNAPPIGPRQYADGMNLYGYTKGNPADRTDPSGLSACCSCPAAVIPPTPSRPSSAGLITVTSGTFACAPKKSSGLMGPIVDVYATLVCPHETCFVTNTWKSIDYYDSGLVWDLVFTGATPCK